MFFYLHILLGDFQDKSHLEKKAVFCMLIIMFEYVISKEFIFDIWFP